MATNDVILRERQEREAAEAARRQAAEPARIDREIRAAFAAAQEKRETALRDRARALLAQELDTLQIPPAAVDRLAAELDAADRREEEERRETAEAARGERNRRGCERELRQVGALLTWAAPLFALARVGRLPAEVLSVAFTAVSDPNAFALDRERRLKEAVVSLQRALEQSAPPPAALLGPLGLLRVAYQQLRSLAAGVAGREGYWFTEPALFGEDLPA
jgi:hypothetical protein